jgi:hypothetical protein
MEGVAGVFQTRAAAESAVQDLAFIGCGSDRIIFLTPASTDQEIASVPTTEAEQPGTGKAIATYVGTAIGASAGLGAGAALASLFVPGVGPIMAAGIGAAALLGAGGAAVGSKIGDSTEVELDCGVPRDDLEHYRELLRRGHSLVIANVDTPHAEHEARAILKRHGGELFQDVRNRLTGEQHAA